jgi:hypothetical protein
MSVLEADILDSVRTVQGVINYVAPDSLINRRFVVPGNEHNTGRFEPHTVTIRDGRQVKARIGLDSHGFVLAERPSAVVDFDDKAEVDRLYPDEVAESVRALTGATRVAVMGWVLRTSGEIAEQGKRRRKFDMHGMTQPPASDAHVDMTPDRAARMARGLYERHFPDGKGYSRFIASSLWRAYSDPPQDWPLAICEGPSVRADEGVPNTMFVRDQLPSEAEMLGEMPGEDQVPAAAIFHHSPAHRWWYFSNMTRDEVIMLKFHDSDQTRAWRTPHTAFLDPSFPDANTRRSIECRSVAYFE